VRLGAALTGALLTTLASPLTWPLGLATFLLRGGILLVLLPIVVLPSPVGLGNLLAPILMTIVFQGIQGEVVVLAVAGTVLIVGWLVVGGLVAAILEADAARSVARDEDTAEAPGSGRDERFAAVDRALGARLLAARIAAHAPTAVILLLASVRLVDVAYAELTRPADVTAPIVLRVLSGAPEVVILLAITWAFGEVAGALATRRIAFDGVPVVGALRDAVGAIVRHPLDVVAAFAIPTAGLAIVVVTSAIAAAVAWSAVRVAIRSSDELILGTLAVVVFVALWMVGLLLISVTAAWRAAVWSVAHRDLWPNHVPSTSVENG
jgi:hypothetical protein